MVSHASLCDAANAMRAGGVIAYPTESCFGLGCDPSNNSAIRRLLRLKKRKRAKGLILIASNLEQLEPWVDISASQQYEDIISSWPGPYTWIIPAAIPLDRWLVGGHSGIAVRVTAHPVAAQLCALFGGPIVSTSANIQGRPALKSAQQVGKCFGSRLQSLVHGKIGSLIDATEIRDGMSGELLRGATK
jgi:L-threonylcarbamoyladenylate synthase